MFAGVGGICRGFENAGFSVVWANEYNKNAAKTYEKNFSHQIDTRDVTTVHPNEFDKVDVITSGFPCQAFSVAGYRQGFNDEKGRGNLFLNTAQFISDMKPKAFLLENVKNLVGHDSGNTLKTIRNVMENELGYSFIPFVLNSKNFGVPQTRERLFIVGFSEEVSFLDGKPLFNKSGNHKCSQSFSIPKGSMKLPKLRDFIESNRQDDKYYYKPDHRYYPQLKESMVSRNTAYQWRRVYVRENKNDLCPTLTANMGTGGHNVPLILDDFGIRKLTPKECFNLQGFYLKNRKYEFPENMPNSHLYKQAGNSVTVPVIEAIARNIKTALDKKYGN